MPKIDRAGIKRANATTPKTTRHPMTTKGDKGGDWKTRATKEMEKTRGYISKGRIKGIEKGIAGRAGVKLARAHVASEIERLGMETATGSTNAAVRKLDTRRTPTRQLATREARRNTMGKASTRPGERTMHTCMEKVRNWITSRTSESMGTPHLTPPMVKTLKTSLGKGKIKARDVEATLMILANNGEMTMEWRVTGEGGSTRDPALQAAEWMEQNEWMGTPAIEAIIRNATPHIRATPNGTPIILDVFEGYGGTKEGLSRVATTYGIDRTRQMKGTKEGRTVPDMMFDVNAAKGDIVGYAREKSMAKKGEIRAAHFSPNCKPHSVIQSMEEAMGRTVSDELSHEEHTLVWNIVRSILLELERNPAFKYTIENPRGSKLAKHPGMQKLGKPKEVRMCCYGYTWSKPTWIWTNLQWTPKPFSVCKYCKTNTPHPSRIVRRDANDHRPPPHIPGFTIEAAKNRIHPDVAEEWARLMIE